MNSAVSYPKPNRIGEKMSPQNRLGTQCQRSDIVPARPTRHAKQLRIALVDDDEGVCVAVAQIVKSEGWVLEYYSDGDQAVKRIPFAHPDIVLMDIRIPRLSGIECTKIIKCHAPILSIIMLTAYSDFESIIFSIMAGAVGYLLKPFSLEQFKDAIFRVTRGGTALCDEAQKVLLDFHHQAFLHASRSINTQRELEVMTYLIQNLSDKEIAAHLNIAPNTVHVHLVHLFKRLGAHSRKEAVQKFSEDCIRASCSDCHLALPCNAPSSRTQSANSYKQLVLDF